MTYVDLAIGIGFFLFFIALVMGLSMQYLVQIPSEANIEEYRESAIRFFEQFFSTSGSPDDWVDSDEAPSELGLSKSLYRVPILVEEPGTAARENETVVTDIIFDEGCTNKAWNDTIRLYDHNLNQIKYDLVNPVYCSDQYLNESYIRFNVNISQSDSKQFFVFYSEDTDIGGPNSSVTYCTDSWVSCSGDGWSESLGSWSRHGGDDGTPATNDSVKFHGAYSIEIEDDFDNEKLGLTYQPGTAITGVSNNWYFDSWVYIDDTTGLSSVNVSLNDGSDTIVSSVASGSLTSGEWYHFEKELTSAEWESWDTFDASNDIASVTIYMVNSTPGLTKKIKVDEVHFEMNPITIESFPEDSETVISMKKVSALNNLTYEQLKDVIGEDYKFRIDIIE